MRGGRAGQGVWEAPEHGEYRAKGRHPIPAGGGTEWSVDAGVGVSDDDGGAMLVWGRKWE